MRNIFRLSVLCLMFVALRGAWAQAHPEWTTALKPFRIAGNLYYVGSQDLAAYLVVTPAGNILINSNLATSPRQIKAAVEELGFRWKDTKILLNSQAHYDHAAGAAEVVAETGAQVMVMDGDVLAMESGDKNDFGGPELLPFAPVHVVRVLHDMDAVSLGGTLLVARKTAGHTPGCTTWTMQVTEAGRVLDVVIVGGFAALDSYRMIATSAQPASYPGIRQDFEHSFAVWSTLPCDIFLGGHGVYFGMLGKLAREPAEGRSVWIDPAGYRAAVAGARAAFEARVAAEQAKLGGVTAAGVIQ
jgi:metallo-beta-lactamase class B